ncbi:MAG: nitronate monooxygenase [Fibrobacteria bacterium]|nr:nitronate monooxygenase [Fibrobacteria bacterium]
MLIDRFFKRGSDYLGVKYPILCGAMTWVSDFGLAKAVSESGGFPILAGGNMPPDLFEKEVDQWTTGLKHPFAVNLITISPNYRPQQEILETKKVPHIVFAGGFPRRKEIENAKKTGAKVMSFAPEESIARQQISFGIDGLILEGSEAGGHIGHVSLTILLQQVLFNFDQVPVFVAGGLATGKIMAHLLTMGAAGCQMGTRFVMTEECNVHPAFKKVFQKSKARHAISTPQYDSKLPVVAVRAIKNNGMEGFGKLQLDLLNQLKAGSITREKAQYEVENYWMGSLRNAVVDGDIEGGSLMAGQSVGLVHKIQPMNEVMQELVQDAEKELQKVKEKLS